MISFPPMPMMLALANPNNSVAELVTRLVDVRLFLTFWNKRSTPLSKVLISCASALNPLMTRMPFNVSVNRPVTSAFKTPRSRKIGRM